jgi:hyperosmotically inducible protein
MSRSILTALAAAAVLAAAFGCGRSDMNGNTATVGASPAYTPASDAGDTRPLNANITREEFERDKSYYEREARRLRRAVGPAADDLWVWWKTRSALAAADEVRDLTINVDVENGVVTLTGAVASGAQKERAERVTRGVGGVKDVKNSLTVGQL